MSPVQVRFLAYITAKKPTCIPLLLAVNLHPELCKRWYQRFPGIQAFDTVDLWAELAIWDASLLQVTYRSVYLLVIQI
ncbi:MAG: hypothetical protein V7K27_07685 [Nostoc sp.]|uniref:hypothetical protein n=1 Tax=Nostoc sp. TaxID=1180 RepID=UPI002FF4D633